MWEFHILYANKNMTGWLKAPYPGRYLESQVWVVQVVARLFISSLSSSKFGYNNKKYQRRPVVATSFEAYPSLHSQVVSGHL